jgi:hypothetical protein
MAGPRTWRVTGTYFEACNCDAICPCRVVGDRPGGRSSSGICEFVLSWHVRNGLADVVPLDDLAVVMAGWYDDDEKGSPWRVTLYVDDRAEDAQHAALAAIFLGRAGGGTLRNFAGAIGTVHGIRPANIMLSHVPRRWSIRVASYLTVSATRMVDTDAPVACGIPGLDRPGTEVISDVLTVDDPPLGWDFHGRCGFSTDFDYSSDCPSSTSALGPGGGGVESAP